MSTLCLITGCALVDDRRGAWVWGDLHMVGDCYAFVACTTPGGEVAWNYEKLPANSDRYVALGSYIPREFESRGVLVFPRDDAVRSAGAEAYIQAGRRA